MHFLHTLALALTLGFLGPITAAGRVACPPGRYLAPAGAPVTAIEIFDDGTVAADGACPAIAVKLKSKRRFEKVRAVWPKDVCAELRGKVRLKGKIDDTCSTLRGRIKAKKFRQRFVAERSRCDDGLLDALGDADCPRLEGPDDSPAIDATRVQDLEPGIPEDEIEAPPTGGELARTRLDIEFAPDATVGTVNAVLDALGAEILMMTEGAPLLLVRIPDPGSLAALDALVDGITDPNVRVRHGYLPEEDALPANFLPVGSSNLTTIDHHLGVGAAAAWNAQAALHTAPLLVIGDLFGDGVPNGDVAALPLLPSDFATGRLSEHGYHVLGIATGTFGGAAACQNGVALSQAALRACTTGMMPAPVPLRVVDVRAGLTTLGTQMRLVARASVLGNAIISTSLHNCCGGTCGDMAVSGELARQWATLVRAVGLEDDVLHLTSAGNIYDSVPQCHVSTDVDAVTNSAFTAAALLPSIPSFFGTSTIPPLGNVLVVENVVGSTAPPFAPRCLRQDSKAPGHVSGVGHDVLSITNASTTAGNKGGTSMSTPQVAGLAAYLWALDPDMSVAELRSVLVQTSAPVTVSSSTAPCDSAATAPSSAIDAYAAVLSLDDAMLPTPTTAPIRHAIMDHDADGRFDETDVRAFLDAYFTGFVSGTSPGTPVEPTDPSFGREDLNGDGFVGGSGERAFDLDRVDSIQYGASGFAVVEQPIESTAAVFDEAALSDLEILCYYAYSDLYEGSEGMRTTLLGTALCNPIRVTLTYPASVMPSVPEVLTVDVSREDPLLGSVPFEAAEVALDVVGGSALAATGTTDAQGRFQTEVTATPGSASVTIVARVRATDGGSVLAEGMTSATVVGGTTTTTTTTPPPSGTVTLRDGTCVANAEVNGSPFYNNSDRQSDGPVPVSLSASGNGNSANATGTSQASATAAFNAALIPATSTGGIGGFHFTGSGTHQVQIVVLDPDALGGLTAFANTSIGCGSQEFTVSGQVAFSVTGSITVQAGNSSGGGSVAIGFANPPFTIFFGDSLFDSGTLTLSGGGTLGTGQYKVGVGANSQSFADRNGGPTDGDGSISMDVRVVFSAPGATTTTTTSSTSSTSTVTTSTTTTTSSSASSTTETSTTTTITTTTTVTIPPGGGIDFHLYPATGPDGPSVSLADEFLTEMVDLGLVETHLAVAAVGGPLPLDSGTDTTCYAHPGTAFSGTVSVVNRFSASAQLLSLGTPVSVCVPRDGALIAIDHYTCYEATGAAIGQVVTVGDRFQTLDVTVGAPTRYCTPVDKNGEGILVPPTDQVVCYSTSSTGTAPGAFEVTNQFHTTTLDLAAPSAVCVSSFVPGPGEG